MLEGWKAHGVSMFQIAAQQQQHTSWAAGMVKDLGAEMQRPVQMQQHTGGHGSGLSSMYSYMARVCGDVGGIGSTNSRMELLGQLAVAPTVDRLAQGLAQVQECAVQGLVPVQARVACGRGVRGGVGSSEGDCLRLRGVTGQCGEQEAHVA